MGKRKGKKSRLVVEDHGNGFMIIGTNNYRKAARELADYVDNIGDYRFACPTHYEGRSACWLSTEPGAMWDGARDHTGRPVAR